MFLKNARGSQGIVNRIASRYSTAFPINIVATQRPEGVSPRAEPSTCPFRACTVIIILLKWLYQLKRVVQLLPPP